VTAPGHPIFVKALPLADLSPAERDSWRALHAASPRRSPLTSLEFATLADAAHGDVRVLLAGRDAVEFVLPFHARANRFARPLGGAFSDVHAPLIAEGFAPNLPALLRRAGLSAFRFTGLDMDAPAFAPHIAASDTSFAIRLDQPAEAFLAARRAEHAKQVKNYTRLENKLAREQGELRFEAPDMDEAHFEQLLAWKRDQLHRTGFFDILAVPENERFLRLAWASRHETGMRGLLLTLTLNGKPIAAHFGVQLGDHYHPWIAAYDAQLAQFSPGITLISRAIQAMPALGLSLYELGVGHAHYKKIYANEERPLHQGIVYGGGARAAMERTGEALGRSLESLPRPMAHAAARLRRRADQIAVSETRPMKRAAALADAFLKRSFAPEGGAA
jgi:CelD/BcsL family acetyltransferase involved in cellulose biosynthesis